jgi:hypothetical protein
LGNLVEDGSGKSKGDRKNAKTASKEVQIKELKKEVEAMTTVVGYKGAAKSKAAEVMMLNSKEPLSKRERKEQQEALKAKVNQLFDMRASDALTINKIKRSDSIFDKVKNFNENYFGGRESLKKKRQDVIAEVDDEDKDAGGEGQVLLTTEGGEEEVNNAYFKNLPPAALIHHDAPLKDDEIAVEAHKDGS